MKKSEINSQTTVTRKPGFTNSYSYQLDTERYTFSTADNGTLEVWDKKFNGEYEEYPGTYHSFDGNKKDFVDFVFNYLN